MRRKFFSCVAALSLMACATSEPTPARRASLALKQKSSVKYCSIAGQLDGWLSQGEPRLCTDADTDCVTAASYPDGAPTMFGGPGYWGADEKCVVPSGQCENAGGDLFLCDLSKRVDRNGNHPDCYVWGGWPGGACVPRTGPTCGDGRHEKYEHCDDGNTVSGDGCSATCEIEASCRGILRGTVCSIAPTGDTSGHADAANLQGSLAFLAGAGGGTLRLTDGDETTVDRYYVSRNIVVKGFWGTIEGEGMDQTFVVAGRDQVSGDGFQPGYSPMWNKTGYQPMLATVFQLYYGGDVTVRDLSALVPDEHPTDPLQDWYGATSTYITSVLEVVEGDGDITVERVRIEGKEAPQNFYKTNVYVGFHGMNGPITSNGSITYRDNVTRYVVDPLVSMRRTHSTATIVGNQVHDATWATEIAGMFDTDIVIRDNYFHVRGDTGVGARTLNGWALNDPNNTFSIEGNTLVGSGIWGGGLVYWGGFSNASVRENAFVDMGNSKRPAILMLAGSGNVIGNNDYSKGGFQGWNNTHRSGAGIIWLRATSGNTVNEVRLPPGTKICEQVYDDTDDHSTPQYDGANTIVGWDDCPDIADKLREMDAAPSEEDQLMRAFAP